METEDLQARHRKGYNMSTITHPARQRIERANAVDAEQHTPQTIVLSEGLPVAFTRAELRQIVNQAARLGITADPDPAVAAWAQAIAGEDQGHGGAM